MSFIDEVVSNGAGTLQELLGAKWTIISNGATDEQVAPTTPTTTGSSGRDRRARRAQRRGGRRPRGDPEPGGLPVAVRHRHGSNPVLRGVAVSAGWRASTRRSRRARHQRRPARPGSQHARRRARSTPRTPPTRCAGLPPDHRQLRLRVRAVRRHGRLPRQRRRPSRHPGIVMLPVDTATTVAVRAPTSTATTPTATSWRWRCHERHGAQLLGPAHVPRLGRARRRRGAGRRGRLRGLWQQLPAASRATSPRRWWPT